ncbi:uncharacterized protein LOC141640042 [Silene latifolia]|uniref:uncharacterized protein LOC141640042 n=1 Tax=Silene latifolia TaxID=37657 RepID=UPI003D76A7AF
MYSLGFWNVRGLNNPAKQRHVKWFMYMNKVGLFGLQETKVKVLSLNSIKGILMDGWSLSTNNIWHKGGRIWVLWDPTIVQVDFCDYSAQCNNMRVTELATDRPCGSNWKSFAATGSDPWIVCGDFNCVLSHTDEFQQCLTRCGLVDSPAIGSLFTWNNKQEPATRVCSRFDRVLINENTSAMALKNLEYIQSQIVKNPRDAAWITKEISAQQEYKELQTALIKRKFIRNQVLVIKDVNGVEFDEPHGIQEAFLNYYKNLLGTDKSTTPVYALIVRKGTICDSGNWEMLLKLVTHDEIKESIFSIHEHKAPGPDGYSSVFS